MTVQETASTGEGLSELRRLLCPVDAAPISHGSGDGPPQWLTVGDWRLIARPRRNAPHGSQIERFALPNGEFVDAVVDDAETHVWVPFDFDEAFRNYVSEAWRRYAPGGGLSQWQLNVYYRIKDPRVLELLELAKAILASGLEDTRALLDDLADEDFGPRAA